MLKLLIDCDTGIDDSIALLFALRRADGRVLGITTGCGNTSAAQAAENTLRLIQLAKAPYEIPVAVGANKPLAGEWRGPDPHIHGDNGIGNVELPPSPQKVLPEPGWDFLARMAREHPGELTLVTLGRMTNLALALEKEPELPRLLKNVVSMGGTLFHAGNVGPVSEANMARDPEAADIVLRAGFDLTLVGLDVTAKTHLTGRHLELLDRLCAEEDRPVVDYIRAALAFYFKFNRAENLCLDYCPVHDPLAMLTAFDPGLMTMRKFRARVECGGTYCRGMVVTDRREHPFDAPFTSICVDVDGEKAVEELLDAFLSKA